MTQKLTVKNSQFKMSPGSSTDTFLIFDCETDGLYDAATTIHCLVIYDVVRQQTFSYGPDRIADALAHLATADVLIGHNIIFYDIPVLEKLYSNYAFKSTNLSFKSKHIIDTLVCTRLIWPKEVLYELDTEQYPQVPKGLRGSASLKAWGWRLADHKIDFKDFSEYSQEMLEYCIQDVQVTKKLFEFIQGQCYPQSALKLEHDLALAINKQIRAGIPFDVDACLDLVDDLRAKEKQLESHLKEIFPPNKIESIFVPKVNNKKRGYVKGQPFTKVTYQEFNPGSRDQIVQRLTEKYGWQPEATTEKGNPILNDDVLETLPYPEAKPLAEYMLIKKRLGQIADGNNAWLKLVTEDCKIHGDVVTNGCITGRASHRNPNMAQVPASYSPYGKECRSLFYAPNNWDLIGIDAKALELRCLAGYLALWDDGEYASMVTNPEVDIHIYNQKMFGVDTRDIAKRLLYGVLYGAGALKAGTIIDPNEKDETVLRKLGSTAINSFMNGVPALKKLKQQIEEKIATRGYLKGLDGRVLYCRSAFKGLNVLLQASGAAIMKQVVVNVHNNIENNLGLEHGQEWEQLLFIHDEIEVACSPRYTEDIKTEALKAFEEAGEFFSFRCPIQGDAKVGRTWYDVH